MRNHEFDIEKSRISKRNQKKIDEKRKIKQYELNRKRDIVRKRNEENRELK